MAMNKGEGLNIQEWWTLKLSKRKSRGLGERKCGVTLEDTVGFLVLTPWDCRVRERCGLGPVTEAPEHGAGCQEVLAALTVPQGAPHQARREALEPELEWCRVQWERRRAGVRCGHRCTRGPGPGRRQG